MNYKFDFGILFNYGDYLAGGVWYAIVIAFPSILIATVVGMILAAMHLSPVRILRVVGAAYVDVFRTLPVVVLLIWIHYVLPILTGLSLSSTESSILALSMNGSALACEAFRGGLQAIPGTQRQAAWSLGLSKFDILRYVIIPQGFFSTLPALTNVHITIIKNVTVTVLIAVPEVMFRAQELTVQFFRPLELYTGAAVIYVALILSFTLAMRRLERLRKWESV
ncbi:amino acid ABC transporter permease [Oceanibacterium hippocampi]|uniref:Inner membrane amino-acid ABC transporter permease protein YecS n=1 Tax=Oceanibacterium hippocampi TaxID=745714 RepID=A0A1Y5U2K3_9PROT|nr:amino acid ABC transporter permease [Oceanibacterium hippocampi]SLN75282.1 Inner membrane amino-acid ABC transporter permease protein YecS [Oceanibacterium hippocampi]